MFLQLCQIFIVIDVFKHQADSQSVIQSVLHLFKDSPVEYLLVLGKQRVRDNSWLYYSNRNMHLPIENIAWFIETERNFDLVTSDKGTGGFIYINSTSDSEISLFAPFVQVPEHHPSNLGGDTRISIHDFSVIEVTQSDTYTLTLTAPHAVTTTDTTYFVHFPTPYDDRAVQYIIIAAIVTEDESSNNIRVSVFLPTRAESLHHEKLKASKSKELLVATIPTRPTLKPRGFGQSIQLTLGAGDTPYEVIQCEQGDLTGTKIMSSHAIAVVAHVADFKPDQPHISLHPDASEEQLLPWNSLSDCYLIPNPHIHDGLAEQYSGFSLIVSVMAGDTETSFSSCDEEYQRLRPRQSIEMDISDRVGGCELMSSEPVSVLTQVSLRVRDTDLIVGGAMTTILPEKTWSNSYTFNIPSDGMRYYTILVVEMSEIMNLLLDEGPLTLTWNVIGSSGFKTSMLKLPPGDHRLRARKPNSRLAVYLLSTDDCVLGLSPAYVQRQAAGHCINTVSYDPAVFGNGDHIDNDCDGFVDEELCVGEFLNHDEDGDGRNDEDCASWADTSYQDSCETNEDCKHYGQIFDCRNEKCTCPRRYPPGVKNSRGWLYDHLDGMCWPAGLYNESSSPPYHRENEECGASAFQRNYYGNRTCTCFNYANPWNNNMMCHDPNAETYCIRYWSLCSPWQVCISSDTEFHCIEPMSCFGEKMMDCAVGLTCTLIKGEPHCEDMTDDCVKRTGQAVCPIGTKCVDRVNSFSCEADHMHPCDDVSFAACIPNHICKKMLGNSYECVTDFGMSERPNICDHNLCRDNFVCVGKENSYLCQAHIPCDLVGEIDHNCNRNQECIALSDGHMCVPSKSFLLYGEQFSAEEARQINTMLIVTGVLMMMPMGLFVTRMLRSVAKEKAAKAALEQAEAVANHQKKMKLENLKKVVDEGKKKTMTLKWKVKLKVPETKKSDAELSLHRGASDM